MIRTANRVALYARFSSDNQRSESIDAQVRAMEAYCKQHSYVIVNTYVDEAKSATTDRRPAFQQMISDSSSHSFDILLVHKLDRFARNRYDSAVYKRELKKNGVTVYSVLENLDDSPESIIMESVLEGMSEYYSQNLAREVMKGMRETALQGKHTGGKPPLGYDVDPASHKLVVNEAEAETVRLIYDMYRDGYGYSSILEVLHEKGSKTKKGQEFQKNSLYSILTNPKYQGMYIFNRSSAKSGDGTRNTHLYKESEDIITIEGGCPQIVDSTTFKIVQNRIQGNKRAGGRQNAKTNYLLSGKVRCKECGRMMIGNTRPCGRNKKIYSAYRCPSKKYACSNKEINREYLESYVVMLLEEYIFNRDAMKELIQRINNKSEGQAQESSGRESGLEEKLEEIEGGIQNIADAIAAGLISEALVQRLSELEQEKADLERKLYSETSPAEHPVIDPHLILDDYRQVRDTPASPRYKTFLQGFLGEIVVGRYSLTITLKTGLELFPDLDTAIPVRRQEIYERKKRPV